MIRRGELDSARTIFVRTLFSLVLKNKRSKNDHTKIVWIDLDSPCRKLSNGGLESVVTGYDWLANWFFLGRVAD